MSKVLSFFLFNFSVFSVYASSFNDLYLDLVNFWRLDRHSVYLNDVSQRGMFVLTGNKLDFSLTGHGFFVVFDDINNVYFLTRNGNFSFTFRFFLVNEDGYYVLNPNNKFIHMNDINLDMSNFRDNFLIAIPKDNNNTIITSKYVISPLFIPVTCPYIRVHNKTLEAMPFNLGMLLEKAILDINNNKKFDNKEGLIDLVRKRFFQVKDWNMMLPYDSYLRVDNDALMELLNKIEIFEQKLLSNLCSP